MITQFDKTTIKELLDEVGIEIVKNFVSFRAVLIKSNVLNAYVLRLYPIGASLPTGAMQLAQSFFSIPDGCIDKREDSLLIIKDGWLSG